MHWEEISAVCTWFQEKDTDSGLLMTQVVGYDSQVPRILAIETTYPYASIALLCANGQMLKREFESHRQQNQMMFAPLKELLGERELIDTGVGSVDLILVGLGPGSYSGARIAIAAAQGLGIVHGCDVVGLSSYYGLRELKETGEVVAVGDARRRAFFTVNARLDGLVDQPELMEKDEFLKRIKGATKRLVTMETQNELPGGDLVESVRPKASLLIEAWNGFNQDVQSTLRSKQVAPAYLRSPFITKAKAGHPLLRGRQK